MDVEVQKPVGKSKSAPVKQVPTSRKVLKQNPPIHHAPRQERDYSNKGIWGPRAPPLDRSQPMPGSNDSKSRHRSGVYPEIYGPDSIDVPGSGDQDSSNPPPFDFLPAPEFPAGPLFPSPYLNDFSKILKT